MASYKYKYDPPVTLENPYDEECIARIWGKSKFPAPLLTQVVIQVGGAVRFDYLDSNTVNVTYEPMSEHLHPESGWRLA